MKKRYKKQKYIFLVLSILFFFSIQVSKKDPIKSSDSIKVAYLAGGCFWGMEHYLKKLEGIISTDVGYVGGIAKGIINYNFVKTGLTDFAEVVRVTYNPNKIDYYNIVRYFFRIHDPTTLNKQGNDIGKQYRSAIFTNDKEEIMIVNDLIKKINKSNYFENDIVTTIEKFNGFYLAEEYHQDYIKKNPNGYICHLLKPDFDF